MSEHSSPDLAAVLEGLPEPEDDGACDHLDGMDFPDLRLRSAGGGYESTADLQSRFLVAYLYPRTGGPDVEIPDGWDLIPGARGCTPQGCAFQDHQQDLAELDATVWGISAQPIGEQADFAERMHIPFPLLNDQELTLSRPPLRLPTFAAAGMTLFKRATLVVDRGVIRRVFYPVFPPDQNAREVVDYLRSVQKMESGTMLVEAEDSIGEGPG